MSTSDDFDIGIATEGDALGGIGRDFCEDARQLDLAVASEHKPTFSVKAGLNWVIPTAVGLFLANEYLGTLLQEAAKDHYPKLKAAVLRLARRTTGTDRKIRLTVLSSSAAKVAERDPATLTVWIVLRDSRRAVFRFDHRLEPDALTLATESLFRLLEEHAAGDPTDFLSQAPTFLAASWAPVVLRFQPEKCRWEAWTIDRHRHVAPVVDRAAEPQERS
jgi:hypothetical protein